MVIDRSCSIGSYLWDIGELTPMQLKVAIISQNRPEYLFVEQACYMYGFTPINLYTSYSPATIFNPLERTEPEILVVDNLKRIESIENDLLENKQS
jgi:long-subunit acyl-CoA synthetase (AMP-forming)